MNPHGKNATFGMENKQKTRKQPMKRPTLRPMIKTFTSRIQLVTVARSAGPAGVLLLMLAFATVTVQAQSGFYRPLTLAPAQEDTSGGGAPLPVGVLSGASVPAHEQSADEIAKELANPNNSLASLTFKNQLRWYEGDLPGADDQFNYTMVFQPVFPFTMPDHANGAKANLFVRPGIPILVNQPVFNAGNGTFDSASGLGDIGFDIVYGVTEPNGLLWAFGMVGSLPTATDSRFASGQLRLGPEGLLAKFEKWGLYGIFPSHLWNVTGWRDDYYANTQIQPVITGLPGGGWSVGTTPIMNYDWAQEQWSIPLNLTISKTIKSGSTPVKLAVEINYYVKNNDAFGAKWMISFNVTPVVKNVFNSWLH